MRVLGGGRLSRRTDESTSPARQEEQIRGWAGIHGHTVTHITMDLDVSGSKPAILRPELGPWLTSPDKIAQWDILVCAKLDRITRSTRDFDDLLKWCATHGKTLVSVAESFDLTTPMGRAVAMIIAVIAQLERERVGERRAEATAYLREVGRWTGGRPPYGYVPEPLGESGWQLVPDPQTAPVVEWAAGQIIARQSSRSVAKALTAKQIPTPLYLAKLAGRKEDAPMPQWQPWSPDSLRSILRNPALKGYTVSKGQLVRGPDGLPVRREPILSDETWHAVQAALDSASTRTSGVRRGASLLLRIAFCGQCGEPVYLSESRKRGDAYYRCIGKKKHGTCNERNWRKDSLENAVTGILMDNLAEIPMMKKQIIPASDNAAQIKRIEQDVDALDAELKAGHIKADRYAKTVSMLDSQLETLRGKPSREESVDWVPLIPRVTFGQHWASLDAAGRHSFLLSSRVRIFARHLDEDEPAGMPLPDPRGTVIRLVGNGMQITLYLGDMAELRKRAATRPD